MRYRVHNIDSLGDLLKDGMDRPKLRLILRASARAKSGRDRKFVGTFIHSYRNYDEDGLTMTPAQKAKLEKIE